MPASSTDLPVWRHRYREKARHKIMPKLVFPKFLSPRRTSEVFRSLGSNRSSNGDNQEATSLRQRGYSRRSG
eukprot:1044067-Amphidinium_carterae.1